MSMNFFSLRLGHLSCRWKKSDACRDKSRYTHIIVKNIWIGPFHTLDMKQNYKEMRWLRTNTNYYSILTGKCEEFESLIFFSYFTTNLILLIIHVLCTIQKNTTNLVWYHMYIKSAIISTKFDTCLCTLYLDSHVN